MKKLLIVLLATVPFVAMADSTYHQVRGANVTELSASSSPLFGIEAWRDGSVFLAEPHGIAGCANMLKVENDEHALIGQLRYSLETGEAIQFIVEDTLPTVRQSCWIRRVTTGVR